MECGSSRSGARWSWMWSVDLAGVEQGGAGCGVCGASMSGAWWSWMWSVCS